jgi:hypothetical protein
MFGRGFSELKKRLEAIESLTNYFSSLYLIN